MGTEIFIHKARFLSQDDLMAGKIHDDYANSIETDIMG